MNGDPRVVGKPYSLGKYEVYNVLIYLAAIAKYVINVDFQPYIFASLIPLVVCTFAGLAFIFIWGVARLVNSHAKTSHGTARNAQKGDLKINGLLAGEGVICGQLGTAKVKANKKKDGALRLKLKKEAEFICHSGKVNTLLLAPTGSGKGVSVLIPTLLSYKGSMIVFDPKGENYNITAGWRRTFSRIIRFAPCSYFTARFNPVMAIRDGDEFAFRDANLIADIIFTPPKAGSTGTEEYFSNSAKDMITTALLHVRFCDDIEDKSLAGVLKFLTHTDYRTLQEKKSDEESSQGQEQFMSMINGKHFYRFHDEQGIAMKVEATSIHEIIAEGAMRAINTNAKEKASVFKTVFSKLQLFADPLLAQATSGNDFEIEDFINCKEPITLYLTIPYSDVKRIAPVFNLLISFMLKKLSEGETQFGSIKLKNHLICMFDEFPILGYFPDIAQFMGVLRGYGINFIIVCQALNQLIDLYGKNHPFLDHCTTQIVFAPGNTDDAEEFSRSIGNKTFSELKISSSGKRFSGSSNFNFNENTAGQRLFDASDIKRLPGNKCLILAHNTQPYVAEKCVYYQDSRFKKKLNLKAPQSMKELYSELAGLPSVVRQKKEFARLQNINDQPVKEVKGNGEFIDNDTDLMADDEMEAMVNTIYIYGQSELQNSVIAVYEDNNEQDVSCF